MHRVIAVSPGAILVVNRIADDSRVRCRAFFSPSGLRAIATRGLRAIHVCRTDREVGRHAPRWSSSGLFTPGPDRRMRAGGDCADAIGEHVKYPQRAHVLDAAASITGVRAQSFVF